jgi:hypothetical protein
VSGSKTLREQLLPLLSGQPLACAKKAAYPSQRDAENVKAKRQASRREPPEQLFSYRCPICKQWHLTKLEQHV